LIDLIALEATLFGIPGNGFFRRQVESLNILGSQRMIKNGKLIYSAIPVAAGQVEI
tara:strand:+ start:636 stop:803 length:168 start_codon:yes stop_codon:yes gene_type:complete